MGALGRVRAFLQKILTHDGVLFIPLAALVACSLRIFRGVSCGHDFEFHLISWFETRRSWSEGIFYPHWAQTPNWGAGEPRFVFYPPLTWMLGALLGCLMSWEYVPVALTFLALTATGLSTCALARRFLPAPTATLAGILAAATPYAFFTAYERTAFSELVAAFWIPLLLLFAWRQSHVRVPHVSILRPGSGAHQPHSLFHIPYSLPSAFDGSTVPLALILAAVWLTNAPAGVMASYLLAFAALSAAILHRQWWPVLRAVIATPIALGLAAFYLIPAAWEQKWIAIQQAVDVGMRVSDSWLFGHHSSPDLALHDQVLRSASSIVVISAGFALIGLAICLWRRKLPRSTRVLWLPLALLIPGVVLLQLPISAPIWNLLPKLQFLQFPWRWLMVLDIPFAIFFATATPLNSRRSRAWSAIGWIAVLLIFTGMSSRMFFQVCDEEDQIGNQKAVFRDGTGVDGTDEYAAAGSDNSLIASGLPDGCLVSDPTQDLGESDSGATPVWYEEQGSCDDTYTAQLWQNEHKILQFDSDHDGYVVLRLSRYPAWRITLNGKAVVPFNTREDGLIAVPISAGSSTIDVRWGTTEDVILGRWISSIASLLLLALWRIEAGLARRRSNLSL
jgi:hypothetical protein